MSQVTLRLERSCIFCFFGLLQSLQAQRSHGERETGPKEKGKCTTYCAWHGVRIISATAAGLPAVRRATSDGAAAS